MAGAKNDLVLDSYASGYLELRWKTMETHTLRRNWCRLLGLMPGITLKRLSQPLLPTSKAGYLYSSHYAIAAGDKPPSSWSGTALSPKQSAALLDAVRDAA